MKPVIIGAGRSGKRLLLMALALAGLTGAAQVTQAQLPTPQKAPEYKATVQTRPKRRANVVKQLGGLDLVQESGFREYGMSPKEYGIRFGSRSKGGKTNRLRLAHNAKLKRRSS